MSALLPQLAPSSPQARYCSHQVRKVALRNGLNIRCLRSASDATPARLATISESSPRDMKIVLIVVGESMLENPRMVTFCFMNR